jgi:iron complex outermembrane receptor protein
MGTGKTSGWATACFGWLCVSGVFAQEAGPATEYPIVLTPARMRQPLNDVPAAVTVITAEQIERYGLRTVSDALRLVPGMVVVDETGTETVVEYHAGSILNPRRMNVLVDGVSVYRPGIAEVDWRNLPVLMQDIERIEVVRGPDSVAYGPNSMTAIVNVITKHPSDVARATLEASGGTPDRFQQFGRAGFELGGTSARVSVAHDHDRGYDLNGYHDGTDIERMDLRTATPTASDSNLQTMIQLVDSGERINFVAPGQVRFPDKRTQDVYGGAVWGWDPTSRQSVEVAANFSLDTAGQTWRQCGPTVDYVPQLGALWKINPLYVNEILARQVPRPLRPQDVPAIQAALAALASLGPRVAAPICGDANQDIIQRRGDLHVQDTVDFGQGLRAVFGTGWRRDWGFTESYLGGGGSDEAVRAYASGEYRATPRLLLSAGGYYEHDQLSGGTFSPRVAANLTLSSTQTVRFIYSIGVRTPDIFEKRANWSYTGTNTVPSLFGSNVVKLIFSTHGNPGLEPEQLENREIGYLYAAPDGAFTADVKLFDDRLSKLTSGAYSVESFDPMNNASNTQKGVELQVTFALNRIWSGFVNYSHLIVTHVVNDFETTLYSPNSGSVGIAANLPGKLQASWAYYAAQSDGPRSQSRFGRHDVRVSREFAAERYRVTAYGQVQYLDSPRVSYFRGETDALPIGYSDRFHFLLGVQVSF